MMEIIRECLNLEIQIRKKCLDFCTRLKKVFGNKPIDVWLPNVGVDNGGKIKIFDASFDRMG